MNTGMDEVVRQARDGRADAFESLVEHHGPAMYRLAAAIVGPEDARDVAQEAFVAAWRDLPNLRQVDRFEVWVRRIVINRSRNALRSRGRRPTQRLEAMTVGETASPDPDFREAIHSRDALDAAFEGLSADHRAAVVLHYGAELSIRETADAMGVAVGTAKSRLNAALGRMRAVMADGGPLEGVNVSVLTAAAVGEIAEDAGFDVTYRNHYVVGDQPASGSTGYSECWCLPPDGRVMGLAYDSIGRVMVAVDSGEHRTAVRPQPEMGWGCEPDAS